MFVFSVDKRSRRRRALPQQIAVSWMLVAVSVWQSETFRCCRCCCVKALTPVLQFPHRSDARLGLKQPPTKDEDSMLLRKNSSNNNHNSNHNSVHRPRDNVPSLSGVTAASGVRIRVRNASRMIRPKSLTSSARVDSLASLQHASSSASASSLELTRDDETHLTYALRRLRSAVRVRDELALALATEELSRRPTEQEWAEACHLSVMALRRVMYEGREARARLVTANAGLVTAIAKKHYFSLKHATEAGGGVGTILTMQDMVQEGNLGLMEAAERFEPERGFRFSTYATWWIRQRVTRAISECSRTIRLPAHVHTMLIKISKARIQFQQETGRPPSVPELAHVLEMPVDKLRKYSDSSRNVVSLELPVRSGGGIKDDRRTIGERIASDAPTPEEEAHVKSLRQDIRAVVDELGDREREVVILRFGLDHGEPRTVEETAKLLGISRDRVRLVEARALNKLRHPQRNYRLKDYIGREDGDDVEVPAASLLPERIWSF